MLSYIVRRLLLMIPTLLGITVLVFLIMALSPGGLTAAMRSAEGNMRPEQRRIVEEYFNKRYGLDRPLYEQYFRWLNQVSPIGIKNRPNVDGTVEKEGWPRNWIFGFKVPDLGESFLSHRPVLDVIWEALPITLLLNFLSLPIVYGVSITTGIKAAQKRGGAFDTTSGLVFIALWSLPIMWVGLMLQGFIANRQYWAWFPPGDVHSTLAAQMTFLPHWIGGQFQAGWLADLLWHLVLPVACLTYGGFAFLSKLMRASVLENLSSDFARTARAKGLKESAVLYRHVVANSLLPMITVAAGILPGMLGGSVVVEKIFSIHGMGLLMLNAIYMKDRELVMSETLVIGVISLLSLLVADLLYAVADPRVTYE
jgi:ABC-type dipeptide/oligopeptide/nickel transport system permease component